VTAIVIKNIKTIVDLEKKSLAELKKHGYIKAGDRVVFVSGTRLGEVGKTNALSVVRVS